MRDLGGRSAHCTDKKIESEGSLTVGSWANRFLVWIPVSSEGGSYAQTSDCYRRSQKNEYPNFSSKDVFPFAECLVISLENSLRDLNWRFHLQFYL